MVRVDCKPFRLGCSDFADVFVGCQAAQGLQPSAVIIGVDEVLEMGRQLGMAVIVIAFDCCLLDRTVHAFDLTVGPWVLRLGKPVFDVMAPTSAVEGMATPASGWAVTVLRQVSELDAIIGQYRLDGVGHDLDQFIQERGGRHGVRLVCQPDKRELRCAVDLK